MTAQRIIELKAEIMLKEKQITALAADMAWADGPAYYQMAGQLWHLKCRAQLFQQELAGLLEHTVVYPEWVRNMRYREEHAIAMKKRIEEVLDKVEQKLQTKPTN